MSLLVRRETFPKKVYEDAVRDFNKAKDEFEAQQNLLKYDIQERRIDGDINSYMRLLETAVDGINECNWGIIAPMADFGRKNRILENALGEYYGECWQEGANARQVRCPNIRKLQSAHSDLNRAFQKLLSIGQFVCKCEKDF